MITAKKLSKHLSKLGKYEVFIGLDANGQVGCLPLQRLHADHEGKRVVLIVPVPQKKPLVTPVPAAALPKLEVVPK